MKKQNVDDAFAGAFSIGAALVVPMPIPIEADTNTDADADKCGYRFR